MSEVRGSGRECQATTVPERLRRATRRPRSGATAERSYPTPPSPRPGAVAARNYPHIQEPWLRRAQEGLEELSHVEGQKGRQ